MGRYLSGRGSGWSKEASVSMPKGVHRHFPFSSIIHCISTDIITTNIRQRPLGPFADEVSPRVSATGNSVPVRGYRCMVKGYQTIMLHDTYNVCARAFAVRGSGYRIRGIEFLGVALNDIYWYGIRGRGTLECN